MNTAIVFVMLVYTHGANWIPTLEFKTEAACVKAASDIKRAVDPTYTIGSMRQPMCVRIEK